MNTFFMTTNSKFIQILIISHSFLVRALQDYSTFNDSSDLNTNTFKHQCQETSHNKFTMKISKKNMMNFF